jgi:hypothetical protein
MGRTRRSPARFALQALVLASLFAAIPAYSQIKINELLPNPVGNDVGTERIEIYNAGSTPIDVDRLGDR